MIKSKHKWSGAAALALVGAVPAMVSAQSATDPHAGHHPAEVAAPAAPTPPSPPSPAPTAKADGMMGGGSGMMNGMAPDGGKMPMMGMTGGMDMPMGCMAGGGMPMAADVEGRIGSLRSELKIVDAQTGAWNAFADVLRANTRRAGPVHAAMMSRPKGVAPLSLEGRLDLHDQALATSLANLRALKPALVRLYAVLSTEQKTTADRLLAHETSMMSGMPMSGMPMSGMPGGMPKQ
jgi:hypothetical protein